MRHVRWQAKRVFGVPEDKAQDHFSDPDGRMTKRAGGGFDASDSAQTAVDDAAHRRGRGADQQWQRRGAGLCRPCLTFIPNRLEPWNSCGCRSLCAAGCTAGQMR